METIIEVPEFYTDEVGEQRETKHLGDFLNSEGREFPTNCLFNKGITGCGGTHHILTSKKHSIIAVPFVSLIRSKVSQHKNLLGVHSSNDGHSTASHQDIKMYVLDMIRADLPIKIMVTYDSLAKVSEAVRDANINVYQDVFLLVDEWHVLFNSYILRRNAVTSLLRESRKYSNVTYMTATPIDEEYMLSEFRDLPIVTYKWKEKEPICVHTVKTNKIDNHIQKICESFLNGQTFGNLHMFVNSIATIIKAIEVGGFTPQDVRVVCSYNGGVNQEKLPEGFEIEDVTSKPKKINFYTSTCFEGSDIYDEVGKIYIISDSSKNHTLLDISTLFVQICGRIRDTKYSKEVTHIFTSKLKTKEDITLDEYIVKCREVESESKKLVESFNNSEGKARIKLFKSLEKRGVLNDMYMQLEDGQIIFDSNMINIDIINFKITNHLYNNTFKLHQEYRSNGFTTSKTQWESYADKLVCDASTRVKFEDLFLEYVAIIKDLEFPNRELRMSVIEKSKPFINDAYKNLGIERVKELNYNVTNIKRELTKLKSFNDMTKIFHIVKRELPTLEAIPNTKIVSKLQDIYNTIGHVKKAKVSHLKYWFETKPTMKITKKGRVNATIIIKHKTIAI